MTDLKTLDDARALLTTLKKTKSLKIVEASALPELKWKDGTTLDAVEISHLVSSLKGEGPGKRDANARALASSSASTPMDIATASSAAAP